MGINVTTPLQENGKLVAWGVSRMESEWQNKTFCRAWYTPTWQTLWGNNICLCLSRMGNVWARQTNIFIYFFISCIVLIVCRAWYSFYVTHGVMCDILLNRCIIIIVLCRAWSHAWHIVTWSKAWQDCFHGTYVFIRHMSSWVTWFHTRQGINSMRDKRNCYINPCATKEIAT